MHLSIKRGFWTAYRYSLRPNQKLGYYDRAIVQLQAMLETTNKDLESEIRYYLGETFFNKGDYQQAILEFLKVPYLVNKKTKIDWTPN